MKTLLITKHSMSREQITPSVTLVEMFWVWLRLGCISFGGTTAHLALLQEELVDTKRWITSRSFQDALGFCTLLPGPEATQLAIYIGYLLAGKKGGTLAGICFILPSMLLLWVLSLLYLRFGQLSSVAVLLWGLRPAILALVAASLYKLATHSLRAKTEWSVAVAASLCMIVLRIPAPYVVAAVVATYSALQLGHVKTLIGYKDHASGTCDAHYWLAVPKMFIGHSINVCLSFLFIAITPLVFVNLAFSDPQFWNSLALFFTKTAFVTVGGSYTVLPYVAERAVHDFHWLSHLQMADGLTLAETTPGPLIIVVVFVGFMAGFQHLHSRVGATLGLALSGFYTFLPCFLFVFVGAPYAELLRGERLRRGIRLVTAVVLAAMFQLLVFLSQSAFTNLTSPTQRYATLAFVSLLAVGTVRYRLSAVSVVAIGIIFGIAHNTF